MKKKMTYEQAVARLDEIVNAVQSDSTGIDQLGSLLSEARELIKECREKIYKTEQEADRILADDDC